MDDSTGILPGLPSVMGKPVHVAFGGGRLTSDAGILLLAAIEQQLGLAERLADCIEDPRAPERVRHTLAEMILYRALLIAAGYPDGKFGEHQPLNRQSDSYARQGVDLDVSTLADWVGACTATLTPLVELIRRHVFAADRIHGDDTTVPLLAKGKTITARLWTYVRDDRPFAGPDPSAAIFYYSRNRNGEHPARHLASYTGILQADRLRRVQ